MENTPNSGGKGDPPTSGTKTRKKAGRDEHARKGYTGMLVVNRKSREKKRKERRNQGKKKTKGERKNGWTGFWTETWRKKKQKERGVMEGFRWLQTAKSKKGGGGKKGPEKQEVFKRTEVGRPTGERDGSRDWEQRKMRRNIKKEGDKRKREKTICAGAGKGCLYRALARKTREKL